MTDTLNHAREALIAYGQGPTWMDLMENYVDAKVRAILAEQEDIGETMSRIVKNPSPKPATVEVTQVGLQGLHDALRSAERERDEALRALADFNTRFVPPER